MEAMSFERQEKSGGNCNMETGWDDRRRDEMTVAEGIEWREKSVELSPGAWVGWDEIVNTLLEIWSRIKSG